MEVLNYFNALEHMDYILVIMNPFCEKLLYLEIIYSRDVLTLGSMARKTKQSVSQPAE